MKLAAAVISSTVIPFWAAARAVGSLVMTARKRRVAHTFLPSSLQLRLNPSLIFINFLRDLAGLVHALRR